MTDPEDKDFYAALSGYIKHELNLDYDPVITSTDWEDGRDIQIGDYTWDHDDATFSVNYRRPNTKTHKTFVFYVDSDNFGSLIKSIVRYWPER